MTTISMVEAGSKADGSAHPVSRVNANPKVITTVACACLSYERRVILSRSQVTTVVGIATLTFL